MGKKKDGVYLGVCLSPATRRDLKQLAARRRHFSRAGNRQRHQPHVQRIEYIKRTFRKFITNCMSG